MLTDKNKDSFCPAKWQETVYNQSLGYLNACSKCPGYNAEELKQQRENMMKGIRDESCNYCWEIEESGGRSLRHEKLDTWDGTLDLLRLDICLGNLCNLYCSYCSPRVSTQWQTDVKKNGPYNILYDAARVNDEVDEVPLHKTAEEEIINFVSTLEPKSIMIVGGEPLVNPSMITVLNKLDLNDVVITTTTNLCYKNDKAVRKLAELCETNEVWIKPSLDTVNKNVKEYIRHGFNQELFLKNLYWILDNTKINIEILPLVTAHTVWDIVETYQFITNLQAQYPNRVHWTLEYCYAPANQSFDILTTEERDRALAIVNKIEVDTETDIHHVEMIKGALEKSVYNYLLRQDQQNFFRQFNERNGLTTPEELKFLIEDEIL